MQVKLVQLTSLPPLLEPSPSAQQELSLARDVYEHAALYSLRTGDETTMERSFAQLSSFYSDTQSLLPPSSNRPGLIGLDLMRLVVQNRIAEFHTQLELISPEELRHPSIEYAIQVEQWLMEGAYNKVLEAGKSQPSDAHKPLLDQIAVTVRDEIASCCEKAYSKLKLPDAQRLMRFDSEATVRGYASKQGWTIDSDGYISFASKQDADGGKENEASMGVISNTLVYAKELERIV